MARSVFFSFDYDDVFKVNQVRNSGVFVGVQKAGFRDKAEYEKVKKNGELAIRNWILKQLRGCSVTCVLVGQNTCNSKWVNFEIKESISQKMGLLGIYIHHLNDPTKPKYHHGLFFPRNPLDNHRVPVNGLFGITTTQASGIYETYTWTVGGGLLGLAKNNLGDWVEEAARKAGR